MRSSLRQIQLVLWLLLAGACGDDSAPAHSPLSAAPDPMALAPSAATAPAAAPSTKPSEPTKPSVVAEKPKLISDQWYRTLSDGQPSGWLHVRWTRSTYEGKPTIHDRTESFSSSTRMMGEHADAFKSRDFSDLERTEDGLLLRHETRTEQGDRLDDSIVTWTGAGYERISHAAGMEEKRSVKSDALLPVDSEAFLSLKMQRGEVAVGGKFEYKAPNYLGSRLETVSLAVEARETITVPAGEFECVRVKQSVAGMPSDATLWLDTAGVLRRIVDGRSEIVSTTEREARDLRDEGLVYSITLDADPELPRATSCDRAVVDVSIERRGDVPMPDFPKTPFSREISRAADIVRLELTAHDQAADAIPLPVKDPAFAPHLERTNILCWDAPRVKAALKEAVGDEKDAREIVRKILRYVFVTLKKGEEPFPNPTAVEILELGAGDCSEHCVLFVTLCRSAGVPARRLSGYAQVGDMWGAHSFAEVWLGRWVGCDPTTNDFGTKARYIAFGWSDDPDSFPGVVSERVRGRMSIRTVEFAEGKKSWKTEGLSNPSDREDVLSGLAFAEPPAGWRVRVSPGSGRASGPGVRADINVVAGFGDLTCEMLARTQMRGARTVKFGSREALRLDMGGHGRAAVQAMMIVPYKRRMLRMDISVDDAKQYDAAMATLAKLLAPTFE